MKVGWNPHFIRVVQIMSGKMKLNGSFICSSSFMNLMLWHVSNPFQNLTASTRKRKQHMLFGAVTYEKAQMPAYVDSVERAIFVGFWSWGTDSKLRGIDNWKIQILNLKIFTEWSKKSQNGKTTKVRITWILVLAEEPLASYSRKYQTVS